MWRLSTTVLFIFYTLASQGALASPFGIGLEQPSHLQLKAAFSPHAQARRDPSIQRVHQADLLYAEFENAYTSQSAFVSSVQVNSEVPILVLEHIESHLRSVQCTSSKIFLSFETAHSLEAAKGACNHEHGALIITSHAGCNDEGERTVFRVRNIRCSREEFSLSLEVESVPWNIAFPSMQVEFGFSKERHLFRRHRDIHRRQDSTGIAAVTQAVTSGLASSTPTQTLSSANPSETSLQVDISHSELGTTFQLPFQHDMQNLPVSVGCKNCTTSGSLTFTHGKFITDTVSLLRANNNSSLIKSGNVEFIANGLAAHIELQMIPAVSGGFQFSFPFVAAPGFTIPEIGTIGFKFTPEIVVQYTISGGVELTYGFDLQVPSNSLINIDLATPSNSSVQGFTESTIAAIPFQANISAVALTLTASLRPHIDVGITFSIPEVNAAATVGVFMDLPIYNITLTEQSEVDANCIGLDSTNASIEASINPSISASTIKDLLAEMGNLILVEQQVGVGLGFDARLDIPSFPKADVSTQTTIAQLTSAMPTACLAWQSTAFTPAAAVLAEKTSSVLSSISAAAAAAASKSAAGKGTTHSGVGSFAVPRLLPSSRSGGWSGKLVMEICSWGLVFAAGVFVFL